MNNVQGAANTLPGYTGYKPAYLQEEQEVANVQSMTLRQQEENSRHRNKVPGYQGFVPQVKAENVYGSTYGSTTRQQKEGQIKAGFDCDQ